jgi:hypothetical protein
MEIGGVCMHADGVGAKSGTFNGFQHFLHSLIFVTPVLPDSCIIRLLSRMDLKL